MRNAIRIATTGAAFALLVAFVFPGQAAATTFDHFFSKMSDDEETAYVLRMAKAAEKSLNDAGKPQLAHRVEMLFTKAPQRISSDGMDEFMQAVDALARQELISDAGGEKFPDSPFFVEEIMVRELHRHGIEVPPSFMAAARAGKLHATTSTAPASRAAAPAASHPAAADDDPIGQGGFITPPSPHK